MTDRELLEQDIEERELSVEEYARAVLVRDPRSVRRWLSGVGEIPKPVAEYLRKRYGEVEPV